MEDDILEIADDSRNDFIEIETTRGGVRLAFNEESVHRAKLRVEARKWLMMKIAPKRYGEKLGIEHSGTVNLAQKLKARRERAGARTAKER
jgi:hypothetical protein